MKDQMTRIKEYLHEINGMDALSCGLVLLSLLISLMAGVLPVEGAERFGLAAYLLLLITVIRCFSRNRESRCHENEVFCRMLAPFLDRFSPPEEEERKQKMIRREEKNRKRQERAILKEQNKTFRFFDCPVCRQHLRVPRGNGKVEITCPNCGNKFIRKT